MSHAPAETYVSDLISSSVSGETVGSNFASPFESLTGQAVLDPFVKSTLMIFEDEGKWGDDGMCRETWRSLSPRGRGGAP